MAGHPDRGARRLARMSRGAAPKTPGYQRVPLTPRPRHGVALIAGMCDTLAGSISFPASSFPGSSALRASTPGLKSDDPSGASPLRDRQARGAPLRPVRREAAGGHPGRGASSVRHRQARSGGGRHPDRGESCVAESSGGKRRQKAPRQGCSLFSPDVEGRSPEDSGLPTDPPTPRDPARASH